MALHGDEDRHCRTWMPLERRQAVEILRELHPLDGAPTATSSRIARYPQRERMMSDATLWGAFRRLCDIPYGNEYDAASASVR